MTKLTYEKPELISLIERDNAMGKCGNGSVNTSLQCQAGGIALASRCSVGSSAGSDCRNGTSATGRCRTGGNK